METWKSNKTLAWGVQVQGAIGGQAKLGAIEQFEAMAGKVHTPNWTPHINEARKWVKEGRLVFGRRVNHEHGNDIVGPKHPAWKTRDFWVEVIPEPFDEWRVHVFQGKSIARQKKVLTGEQWRKMPVRNLHNGWTYQWGHELPSEEIREAAKQAVKAVGYDFGAVDIIWKDGKPIVLEVNSAPGMAEGGKLLEAYVKAVKKYVKED